jgi:hypothetical protein
VPTLPRPRRRGPSGPGGAARGRTSRDRPWPPAVRAPPRRAGPPPEEGGRAGRTGRRRTARRGPAGPRGPCCCTRPVPRAGSRSPVRPRRPCRPDRARRRTAGAQGSGAAGPDVRVDRVDRDRLDLDQDVRVPGPRDRQRTDADVSGRPEHGHVGRSHRLWSHAVSVPSRSGAAPVVRRSSLPLAGIAAGRVGRPLDATGAVADGGGRRPRRRRPEIAGASRLLVPPVALRERRSGVRGLVATGIADGRPARGLAHRLAHGLTHRASPGPAHRRNPSVCAVHKPATSGRPRCRPRSSGGDGRPERRRIERGGRYWTTTSTRWNSLSSV